jgi:hypothetical protein
LLSEQASSLALPRKGKVDQTLFFTQRFFLFNTRKPKEIKDYNKARRAGDISILLLKQNNLTKNNNFEGDNNYLKFTDH